MEGIMNNLQHIIIFLWFVPALVFIVIPLLLILSEMFYRSLERTRLGDMRGFVVLNNRDEADTDKPEERNRERIRLVGGGQAYIDEESLYCKTSVSDISKDGICLKNIQADTQLDTRPLRVVFRTKQRDYPLTVNPIWKKVTNKGHVIGARLEKIPNGWKDMVTGLTRSFPDVPARV
jgi:hypothetical protein